MTMVIFVSFSAIVYIAIAIYQYCQMKTLLGKYRLEYEIPSSGPAVAAPAGASDEFAGFIADPPAVSTEQVDLADVRAQRVFMMKKHANRNNKLGGPRPNSSNTPGTGFSSGAQERLINDIVN